MKKGFYTIMGAQFFSSLADSALLIVAIQLLIDLSAPGWMTPLLKLFFVLSYVCLAAFVGAFADSRRKSQVMMITNMVKFSGAILMLVGSHPLIAYGIVGLGAAAYSPAKYGILTELLPAEQLVTANSWIEGTTIASIILGTVLGGILINPHVAHYLIMVLPHSLTKTAVSAAIFIVSSIYGLAALINLFIPDTGARYQKQTFHPIQLFQSFCHCFRTLWQDKLGQISLSVTTLFWGAGAVLQFIVLKWALVAFNMPLSEGAILQAITALGIAIGAVLAAQYIPLKKSIRVLPFGAAMGCCIMLMSIFSEKWISSSWYLHVLGWSLPFNLICANLFLLIIGILAGFFIVPMNALLQHRGHVLLSAGASIAVQNFNENTSILVMLGVYALLISFNISISLILIALGSFLACSLLLIIFKHQYNQKHYQSESLIGEPKR